MAAQFMPTARGACFCSVLQSFVIISCTRDYERPEAVMEEQIAVPFLSFLFYFFLSTVDHFDNARKVSDCKRV